MTPQEMITWLRGEWRLWAHGPLPPDMTLSHVLGDLADFVEKHRWRKLEEEKPPERFGQYQVWIDFEDGTYGASHLHWHGRDGYWHFSGLPYNVTHWQPIVGPEDTDE